MDDKIKPFAIRAAVVMYFLMSIVASYTNVTPATACKRAIIGAVITYILISIVGRIIVDVIIDNLADKKSKEKFNRTATQESENEF